MSKLAARIYDKWFADKTPQKRYYSAAKLNRQNAAWGTSPTGANYERRVSLAALRSRARQASRDNGHIAHFLSLTRSNVIGAKGIRLQARAKSADGKTLNVELNREIENAWREWGQASTCTLSGKLGWKQVQNLTVTQLACDGEFLVQMIDADNDFGFALKVWDVNWLDEMYNDTLPGGNRVIMSVEIDANDRPVAYWLTTPATEINFTRERARKRTRVPAEQMIHGFLVNDDESQARGVTWFHAALLDVKNFQGYTEGVIQSARWASNTFGFLSQTVPDGTEPPYTGQEQPDGTPTLPPVDTAPGTINGLPPGTSSSSSTRNSRRRITQCSQKPC
jgi:lambda family phage portal protein